jgi:hypothetical protein
MKHIALLVLTILLFDPAPLRAADPPPPLAVFVGEQIDFAELPDPCEDPDNRVALHGDAGDEEVCVVMDSAYWARYRVREDVVGSGDRAEIEFLVADHYGVPEFARARTALLFVTLEPEGNTLLKYQAYPVFATADGDWAMCGDPYPDDYPADRRRVVPIEFAAGLAFADLGTLSPYAAGEFDPEIYEREGDRLRCRRGVRLMDLFEFVVRERIGAADFDFGLPDDPPEAESGQAARP